MNRMLRGLWQLRHRLAASVRLYAQSRMFLLLYGPGAGIYDRFTEIVFAGEWRRWQDAALAYLPGDGVIVEIGCGTGRFAASATATGRYWVGIDRSPAMLKVARRQAALSPPRFILGDATSISLASTTADAIVATFPAAYLRDPGTAHEISRVLKPGGRVVVVLSGELAAHGVRRRCLRLLLRCFYGPPGPGDTADFSLAGFEGNVVRHRTLHGQAVIYIGQPIA